MGIIQNKAKCCKILKGKHKLFKFLCRSITKAIREHPIYPNKKFRIQFIKNYILFCFPSLLESVWNYACMCFPLFKVSNRQGTFHMTYLDFIWCVFSMVYQFLIHEFPLFYTSPSYFNVELAYRNNTKSIPMYHR